MNISYKVAEWFCRGDFSFLFIEYLLIIALWILGLKFNRRKNFRPLWGALCLLGVFALIVAGIMVLPLFSLGTGFGLSFCGGVSCLALPIFLSLMYKTVTATFNKPEKPKLSTKLAIGAYLLFIVLFVFDSIIRA